MQASITRILKKHKSKVPVVRDEFALKEAAMHAGLETHISHKGKYGRHATFTLSISKESALVELAKVTEVWAADLAILKGKAYTAAIELLDKPNLRIQNVKRNSVTAYVLVPEGVILEPEAYVPNYTEPDRRPLFSSAPASWFKKSPKKGGSSAVKKEIQSELMDLSQGDPKLAEAMQNIEKIQRFLKYGCVFNGPGVDSRATIEKAARRAGVELTMERHSGPNYICVMVFVDSELCRVKICELNIAKKLNVNDKVIEKKAYKEALKIMQEKDTKVEKIHGEYQITLGTQTTVWGQASSVNTNPEPSSTESMPRTSTQPMPSTSTGTFGTEMSQRIKSETVVKVERDRKQKAANNYDDECIVLDDEDCDGRDDNDDDDEDDIFVI